MTTVVTGGGGYLGRRLIELLRHTTEEPIISWSHVQQEASDDRVTVVQGELTDAEPFRAIDPRGITRIVHGAAITRFNVDASTARAVNLEGTRKVLEFASRCGELQSVDLLSTIYVAGLRDGVVHEQPLDAAHAFANEYERSKWQCEQLLVAEFGHLPWRICRIATVIADDDTGRVEQQNAVHNTLKLLYYGLLSLVPGRKDVPLYFVTGDFVARALAAVIASGGLHSVYHLCHRRDESLTLGEFVDAVFETYESDPRFRARRALRPLYTDGESFDLMVQQITNFSGGILGQAVRSVAPFARELFSVKDFRNEGLIRVAPSLVAPDARQLIANVCQNLVDTRFGIANASQ